MSFFSYLFVPFARHLLDDGEFYLPATLVTPSVSLVQDSAVTQHLEYMKN